MYQAPKYGSKWRKRFETAGRPDELVVPEARRPVLASGCGGVEPHVLEDVELGVEARASRSACVSSRRWLNDRPLDPQAEVLRGRCGSGSGRPSTDAWPVRSSGRSAWRIRMPLAHEASSWPALTQPESERRGCSTAARMMGRLDVQADVPEDAEVGAQVEEVASSART